MRFKDLTLDDKNLIKLMYDPEYKEDGQILSRKEVQQRLSEQFNVAERTIRDWANNMGLGVMAKNVVDPAKIMIYDIETSRIDFKAFWTGKQFISYQQMRSEAKIISVSWRWLGEEKVQHLHWDLEKKCDEQLMKDFLKEYNKADMVVGFNNKNFDDRWINARAMKYNLLVNVHVKSFDIIKQCKRLFRLPSYSMDYVAKFMGVTLKQAHEGIVMWNMLEEGTLEKRREYIQKMLNYNIGDIVTTEEIFLKLRKYMGHVIHLGVFQGKAKYSCPHCGGANVELFKAINTAAGTPQYIMKCKDDNVQYKISHREYMNFLQSKINKFNGQTQLLRG